MSYRRKHLKPKLKRIKKKKKLVQRPAFWWSMGAGGLLVVLLYVVFFFPALQIKSIEVSGNIKTSTSDIASSVQKSIEKELLNIPGTSHRGMLVFRSAPTVVNLQNEFPQIKTVTIKKRLSGQLMVAVEERQPFAVACQAGGSCYLVDVEGVAFQETDNIPDNLVLLEQADTQNIIPGRKVADQHLLEIIAKVKNNTADCNVTFTQAPMANPLVLKSSEGWRAYFDPTGDIDAQILKLRTLLKGELSENERSGLEYIYLQYKDKAYYK